MHKRTLTERLGLGTNLSRSPRLATALSAAAEAMRTTDEGSLWRARARLQPGRHPQLDSGPHRQVRGPRSLTRR